MSTVPQHLLVEDDRDPARAAPVQAGHVPPVPVQTSAVPGAPASATPRLAESTRCVEEPDGADVNGSGAGYHRIGLVRRRQGVSIRTAARHWDIDVSEVRRQQDESTDLTLSQLYRWQELLDVPVAELLVDDDQPLSAPIWRRAQLIKVMKTAVTMQETAREVRVQRLVATLIGQLLEMMPELAEVGPWHGSGDRRTLDDLGRAVDYRLTDDVLR